MTFELSRRLTAVPAGLERHPALARLDLQFCGSGSEAQVSRGPLGCGFPVVGDHPWLVALGFQGPGGGAARFMCSGALISDQHVVTSARCALGVGSLHMTTARLGEYDFHTKRDCLWYAPDLCTEAVDVPVGSMLVHPEFEKHGNDASPFDLAVVQLLKPIKPHYGVLPICLPMFPPRQPPHRQVALTLGLSGGPQPEGDSAATCCQCDRDRSATSHVMDAQRLDVFNVSSSAGAGCAYRLLVRPAPSECGRPGAAVTYAPVQPHVAWILDSIDRLA
ncbi:serine protease grass-like [Amphibalanus amphitrite]|uniref:serine protease grass-like n=1 Tax=Amphibalanus amphitrite TaxID=1232801 RepID=UPI001C92AFE5|nr:serine protease grass-like [Amphibalanus amphitrite]